MPIASLATICVAQLRDVVGFNNNTGAPIYAATQSDVVKTTICVASRRVVPIASLATIYVAQLRDVVGLNDNPGAPIYAVTQSEGAE